MALKATCSECGKIVWLPEADAGLRAVCPACGNSFTAPGTPARAALPATGHPSHAPAPVVSDDIDGDWQGVDDWPSRPPSVPPVGGAYREQDHAEHHPGTNMKAVSWAVIGSAACVAIFLVSLAVMAQRDGQRNGD